MSGIRAALITHPVRARILSVLMGRRLTTQQIADLLNDVPLPSIYRHVRRLVEGGILESVEEIRVNGAATRVYAVVSGQARIAPEEVKNASYADQHQYLTVFLNTLADNYRAYLEHTATDARSDMTQAMMSALHLSDAEIPVFCDGLEAFLKPWRENLPGGERRRVVFAQILLPDRADPPLS